MTDINKLEEETQKEINEMLASLEKQDKAVEAPVEAPPAEAKETSTMQEFHGAKGDASLEESVGSLKVQDDSGSDQGVMATVTTIRPTPSGTEAVQPGSLQLKLSGSMSLELTYETGGETVSVSFTDDAFVVRIGKDGAEFRLPIKKSGKAFKAA